VNTFMLVMSIVLSDGQQQDVALSFNLSWWDCDEMSYYMNQGLSSNAQIFCELEGTYDE
jgi:hypothetical protein